VIGLSDVPYPWQGTMKEWNKVEVLRKVTEGGWRKSPNFRCKECKDVAHLHPFTNRIWGCKTCGYTTASVSVYFEEIP